MIWAHVGAALFLAGALTLVSREAVPAAPSGGPANRSPLMRLHPTAFVFSCAAAFFAGAAVIARTWLRAPGLASAVVIVLPLVVALATVDVAVHRLPNRLTAALAVLTTVGLAYATAVGHLTASGVGAVAGDVALTGAPAVDDPATALRRALFGALTLGAFYLVLALLGGGSGMGLGDVKLAPSLGALMAWVGWDVWVAGALGAFLLGGAWGVVLMLRGRGRHARMPFGPFMIVGALAAIAFA